MIAETLLLIREVVSSPYADLIALTENPPTRLRARNLESLGKNVVAKVSVLILGPTGVRKLVNCTTSLPPASMIPLRMKPKSYEILSPLELLWKRSD